MKLSIVIPVYEMGGRGVEYLERSLRALDKQTFKEFEIVVSDDSSEENRGIWWLCTKYPKVRYVQNKNKGLPQNTNNALKHAKGELIKILYQDDYLAYPDALKDMVESFKGEWLIVGCSNNPYPCWKDDIYLGNNKLGAPSCLMIKRKDLMMFDENLSWLLDCDYYKRLYDKYGEPTILDGVFIIMGLHPEQATHILSDEIKEKELDYMIEKYV